MKKTYILAAVTALSIIKPDLSSGAADSPYFPLKAGAEYRYEHTGSEFTGVETVSLKIISAASANDEIRATVTIESELNGEKTSARSIVTVKPSGVESSETIISGNTRMEFPLPPAKGRRWCDGIGYADENEISALNISEGGFSGCMKVETLTGGGDAGTAFRIYCPGTGLVYEQVDGEAVQNILKLVSFHIPQ